MLSIVDCVQNVSIPSISLPSCSCGWVAGENDEYSRDYHAFDNAARHGFDGHPEHSGGSVMFVPGAANGECLKWEYYYIYKLLLLNCIS